MRYNKDDRPSRTLVAPFRGAWIEILGAYTACENQYVAPFRGAWIEITIYSSCFVSCDVAPFRGAWIEITVCRSMSAAGLMSHPSRVRGLKF